MTEIDTMTQMTPVRNTRSRDWCLTWNNYPVNWKENFSDCKEYYAQEETGENGNNHIQGCIKYENAISFTSIKKKFPGAHIEKCKNWQASKQYCQKQETRTGIQINSERKINDTLDTIEKNNFQKKVEKIIKKNPDDRTIYWFTDKKGGSGKTTLARHLCIKNKNILYLTGKAADMKYVIKNWLDKHKNEDIKAIIIDIVRSTEGFVSYQGIEEIKNGIFMNTKYECEMCIYNWPHVIIFANFEAQLNKLSLDRWKTYKVENGNLIK